MAKKSPIGSETVPAGKVHYDAFAAGMVEEFRVDNELVDAIALRQCRRGREHQVLVPA
jgi:hypothetical protein